ncbi:hypothetical protein ABZ929_18175 [Streptomyces physcomitrii]|uniref:hypothetical protein n=1 Tax=Streptomyces physcomitrii TaxID=2724184 RepID=UPI0033F66131
MTSATSGTHHVLRREIAGTVGLLTDARDFAAMRRYRSFTFDDHERYLQHLQTLLTDRRARGRQTTLALFDPGEYAEFCAASGLEPDTPGSRARFTAELATSAPAVRYEGQPLREIAEDLLDEALRQATWEYAAALLTTAGDCAACGEDIGRSAFDRAHALLGQVLDALGPGSHHLVCSALTPHGSLTAPLHAAAPPGGPRAVDPGEALEFTTVLAAALAHSCPGGLVVRTTEDGEPDRVHGWRLREEQLRPLTAAEVFDAYCTDAETGELIAPESGVEYGTPPDLGPQRPPGGHLH